LLLSSANRQAGTATRICGHADSTMICGARLSSLVLELKVPIADFDKCVYSRRRKRRRLLSEQ